MTTLRTKELDFISQEPQGACTCQTSRSFSVVDDMMIDSVCRPGDSLHSGQEANAPENLSTTGDRESLAIVDHIEQQGMDLGNLENSSQRLPGHSGGQDSTDRTVVDWQSR